MRILDIEIKLIHISTYLNKLFPVFVFKILYLIIIFTEI